MLFPALTGLEFMTHHVDKQARLVVKVRPSVNHNSLTIEKVLSKMRNSHLQLLDLLTDNLRFAGIPPPACSHCSISRSTQNSAILPGSTTPQLSQIDDRRDRGASDVFRLRPVPSAASCLHPKRAKRHKLAARVGENELAVELLLKKEAKQHPVKVAALEKIVEEILREGCKQPWPQTLAKLISQEKFGNKDAAIPPDRVVQILEKSLASSTYVSPFHVGARVRVCEKMHGASPWLNARIKGERKGTATYKPTIQGKKRVETSGIEYSVEMDGGGCRWARRARSRTDAAWSLRSATRGCDLRRCRIGRCP